MHVLFIYHHLHREVTDALDRLAPGAEKSWVGADDWAPWQAVRARWTGADDLVVVEQHAVLHEGVLPGFRDCPSPWCPQLSEIVQPGNWAYEALSATRFRAGLQREIPPQEIEDYWGSCFSCGPDGRSGRVRPSRPGCWRHMDGEISAVLKEHGYSACTHRPPVLHWKVHRNGGLICT